MKLRLFGILAICFLFSSCAEEKEQLSHKKKENYQPFLFNFQHYFSDAEYNVSFPVWFNDSLIKENKIHKLTRSIYMSSKDPEIESGSPKEVKTYEFNEEGQLLSVEIEHFYENVKVGSILFNYTSEKDEMGFAIVEKHENSELNDSGYDSYNLYEKEKYADKFLVYTNESSGDYLFCMLNKKNWGALSVDSILKPNPSDIIVLGSPLIPIKKYRVKDMVKEDQVVEFTYDKPMDHVQTISFDKYPFHYNRSIVYDKGGNCLGFIDSTFSDNVYLTRRESNFIIEKKLPRILIHESKSDKSKESYYQIEKFEYLRYEE
jgi:hypothetical protein